MHPSRLFLTAVVIVLMVAAVTIGVRWSTGLHASVSPARQGSGTAQGNDVYCCQKAGQSCSLVKKSACIGAFDTSETTCNRKCQMTSI